MNQIHNLFCEQTEDMEIFGWFLRGRAQKNFLKDEKIGKLFAPFPTDERIGVVSPVCSQNFQREKPQSLKSDKNAMHI